MREDFARSCDSAGFCAAARHLSERQHVWRQMNGVVKCVKRYLAVANNQKRTHCLRVPSSGELALHISRFSCMLLCLK